ncbi:hypothetical protein D3C73_790100 [compost metagenome]
MKLPGLKLLSSSYPFRIPLAAAASTAALAHEAIDLESVKVDATLAVPESSKRRSTITATSCLLIGLLAPMVPSA